MEREGTMVTIEDAIALFEQRLHREAFSAFAEIYNGCKDPSERQIVFDILEEAYYLPNVDELRGNYEHNLKLLESYPFFWNKTFHTFEELSFLLFPVSDSQDSLFCSYDKKGKQFCGEYDAKTDKNMRYFFEHPDRALRVKDEDNFYNLTFLNDNVRASEDFAGDNHIYLLYTSLEPLERLMMTCDLEPVLRQQKFVFLIGKKNWNRYPIDFRKEFGIDYTEMEPAPIRIEEVKRVCFWYKHAYSGTVLGLGVFGAASGVQVCSGYSFDTYSKIDGRSLYFSPEFRQVLKDNEAVYTVEQISRIANLPKYHIQLNNLKEYIAWLQQSHQDKFTAKDLFVGYFLFQYEGRKLNPRIVPLLLFDPHMWDTSVYNQMILAFPYHSVLTSMREPIMTFARSYLYGLIGWNEFQTKYILASDYYHAQFLPPELLSCYYGFRFEDLKTQPEVVCRAVCKHLNVPFEQQMLETEAPASDREGNVTKGFDTAPLHRDISAVLSEFDRIRLQMFYEPIHKYYGYPTFSFEEHPISEETVRELFQVPFRFEHINHKMMRNAPPQEVLHEWIQNVVQGAWRKEFSPPQLIPLEGNADE